MNVRSSWRGSRLNVHTISMYHRLSQLPAAFLFGRTISRVLSCVIIYPGRPLPNGSSDRPEARRAAVLLLFGLAPDGACICPACYQPGGSLLHCLFTLTACAAVLFCCAFPRVTPAGRYPASCPAEPGLSSPGVKPAAITCPAELQSYQLFFISAMPFRTSKPEAASSQELPEN